MSQAKHDVKDKNQLLSLIKKYPAGIAAVDLKDAYPNVMDDLQVCFWVLETKAVIIINDFFFSRLSLCIIYCAGSESFKTHMVPVKR